MKANVVLGQPKEDQQSLTESQLSTPSPGLMEFEFTKQDGDKAIAICRRVTLDQDEMALHQVAEIDKSWNIGCDESSVTSIDVGIIDAPTSPPETVGSHVGTLASLASPEQNLLSTKKTAAGQRELLESRLARLEVWGDGNYTRGTDKGFAKRADQEN
jgi:hypothetical protein